MDETLALELPTELTWLNAEPQNLLAHSGRVVVLLFWNASSVYCHNALLELFQLQRKFPELLSAMAIHIPKFTAELDDKIVVDLCHRLDVQLPIANDKNCLAWQSYGVESWPTFIIIDSNGVLVDKVSGDQQLKYLESKITELVSNITMPIKNKTKAMQANSKTRTFSFLNQPSGIVFHNDLLYISDTGNNRIIECTIDGNVKRIFGNGLALNMDGLATEAAFCRPVGLCLDREYLYVADSGNHAIRRVRLLDGLVDTLLGNGAAGFASEQIVNIFHSVQLNNPTSVTVNHDVLVLADSGNNCLWMYNLVTRKFSLLSGSGELGFADGIGARAMLAHPLAMSGSKNYLYVVEGSSSSVRTVAIPEGRVNTLIGHGLFQYGSSDGTKQVSSLQYPCSLVVDDKRGVVWIADSYNRKIRILNMSNNELSSSQMPSQLINPCALALGDNCLWIVDSGANTLYRYYIDTDYLARITIQDS